jgi:putative ABC transport system ATP-binding protein
MSLVLTLASRNLFQDRLRFIATVIGIVVFTVAEPSAILADEPTAALDSANGQAVMTILSTIAKEQSRAVLVVTHDTRLLGFVERIIHIEDGSLIRDERADRKVYRIRP